MPTLTRRLTTRVLGQSESCCRTGTDVSMDVRAVYISAGGSQSIFLQLIIDRRRRLGPARVHPRIL